MKTRILIPYCIKHNKFQTKNHRWLDAGDDKKELILHMSYVLTKEIEKNLINPIVIETTMDLCDKCITK